MAYPDNTAAVLRAAYPDLTGPTDWVLEQPGGVIALVWTNGQPEPTEQQITDWATDAATLPSGQLFSAWLAEHGGDDIATAKLQIKEALADDTDLTRAGFQALIILFLDNLNSTSWVGNATPTKAQAWTAFKNKVDEITGES